MPWPSIQLSLIYGKMALAIQLSDLTSSRIARSDVIKAQVHKTITRAKGGNHDDGNVEIKRSRLCFENSLTIFD